MMVIQALPLSNEIPWKTVFAKYWTSKSLTAYNFLEPWLPLIFHIYESVLTIIWSIPESQFTEDWPWAFCFWLHLPQAQEAQSLSIEINLIVDVYLIYAFYFTSAFRKAIVRWNKGLYKAFVAYCWIHIIFNQCIFGLISVDKLYDWASYF